jgi:hypothetical protein
VRYDHDRSDDLIERPLCDSAEFFEQSSFDIHHIVSALRQQGAAQATQLMGKLAEHPADGIFRRVVLLQHVLLKLGLQARITEHLQLRGEDVAGMLPGGRGRLPASGFDPRRHLRGRFQ